MSASLVASLRDRIEQDLVHAFARPSVSRPEVGDMTERIMQESIAGARYPLAAGGKRVRPLLAHLLAGSIGGDATVATCAPAATALELVHTYSLVHDDLPCMDNDDFRRGKPTTHKIFGEAKALLVGDALLTKAFEILVTGVGGSGGGDDPGSVRPDLPNPALSSALVRILAQDAGSAGMVLGQWLDLSYTDSDVPARWSDLEMIHINKTGMLLAASCEMGVLCGWEARSPGRPDFQTTEVLNLRRAARAAGLATGLAFQIVDDILDATATTESLGKTAGKDGAQNKLTAVALLGLDGARARATSLNADAFAALDELFARADALTGRVDASDPRTSSGKVTDVAPWRAETRAVFQGLLERKY